MPPRQKVKYKIFEHCLYDSKATPDELVKTFSNEVDAQKFMERMNREKGNHLVYYMQIYYSNRKAEE